jgi:hypothetical protein
MKMFTAKARIMKTERREQRERERERGKREINGEIIEQISKCKYLVCSLLV